MRRALPLLAVLMLCLAAPGALAQTFTPSISDVEPAFGTEGTEFTITGMKFGTKRPSVFLTQDGEIAEGTRLKVLENIQPTEDEDGMLRVRVRRAVEGVFQLAVRIQGQQPTFTDAEFEVLAPTIVSVEELLFAVPGAYEIEVAQAGVKSTIRVAGRKARPLSKTTTEAGNTVFVVRPKRLPDGLWDVIYDNRVSRAYGFGAITVENSSATNFPPRYFAWTVDGQHRFSTKGNLSTGTTGNFEQLRLTGISKKKGKSTRMGIAIPFTTINTVETPITFAPPAFPVPVSICFLFPDTSCGYTLTVVLSQKSEQAIYQSLSGVDAVHTVTLNTISETRVAGSFFGEQTFDAGNPDLGPEMLEFQGSFIAKRIEQPFAQDPEDG